MENKNFFYNWFNLTWILVSLSLIAFCVIIGVLIFYSQTEKVSNHVAIPPERQQTLFFTPVKLPEVLSFANEPVPLENFDIRESLDREMLSIANFHSQALLYIKKTNRYFTIIEPILRKNEIPDDFKFLALAESGFLEKIISPLGAVGLWQFMKGTAIENGLEVNDEIDERYHIEKSTEAACKFLKNSFSKYGNWTIAAASYNAGISGINREIGIQLSKNYYDLLLSEETSRYLFRILALKLVIGEPGKYGFKVSEEEKYPIIPVKEVNVNGSVNNFQEFARANNINYKILKQFNPWLRQPYLKNLKKKIYTIKIPDAGRYRKFVLTNKSDLQ